MWVKAWVGTLIGSVCRSLPCVAAERLAAGMCGIAVPGADNVIRLGCVPLA